jgi:hypothetical protein
VVDVIPTLRQALWQAGGLMALMTWLAAIHDLGTACRCWSCTEH